MSGQWGNYLRVSIYGESHGPAIGITIDGLPSGLPLDLDAIAFEMARRAPGRNSLSTQRQEADTPRILSGLYRGRTTGTPLSATIANTGAHSGDYGEELDLLRPGHADYTGHVRYGGFEDHHGGGHFSGRITAPLVFCGAVCKQILRRHGIDVYAHVAALGGIQDARLLDVPTGDPRLPELEKEVLPLLDPAKRKPMEQAIDAARMEGDSLGGVIECGIFGVPAGLGAPFFDSAESVIAHLLFSVPAVKGVEFGLGFAMAALRGSQCNDEFYLEGDAVKTRTNRGGGIQGGITCGMPVVFRAAVRPTASIHREQQTVSLVRHREEPIQTGGRHDPCIVPRAVPVIEGVAAMAMVELLKERAAWGI